MGLIRSFMERRDASEFGLATARIPGPLQNAFSFAGPVVTDDTALAHIDVFKCRSLISDVVAMLPLRAHRMTAYSTLTGVRTFPTKVTTQPLLLTDPMPGDLAGEFHIKHRIMDSLLSDGNAYLEVAAKDANEVPTVLMPVHPSKIRQVTHDKAGAIVFDMYDGGRLGSVRDGGTMIHIVGYSRPGYLTGTSPILAGKQGIALSMAAEEYGARFFGDGANPSGYLHTDAEMAPADAKQLKRDWLQTFGGLSREPAVLYGGLKWDTVSISPEESQFIETRKLQSNQIASLYRIPPHLIGDTDRSTSWGTGVEEMGLGFITYCLGPWLTRIEQAISFLLPGGQFARFDVQPLLRGRIKDQLEALTIGKQWGVFSTNDIREILGYPPVDGGDVYWQPLNMVDAAKAMDVLAPAPPPTPDAGPAPAEANNVPMDLATIVQKLYLGTPDKVVISTEEGREILNAAGANLTGPPPEPPPPPPPPVHPSPPDPGGQPDA